MKKYYWNKRKLAVALIAFLLIASVNNYAYAVYLKKPSFGETVGNLIKLTWNDLALDPGFYIEIAKIDERDAFGYFKRDVVYKSSKFSKENDGYSTTVYLASGDYYWHVQALYGNGTTDWNWDGLGFFRARNETSLSIYSVILKDSSIKVYGWLVNGIYGYSMTNKSIELQKKFYPLQGGDAVPVTVVTIKSDNNGYYSYTFQAAKKDEYRALFKEDNEFQGASSTFITIEPLLFQWQTPVQNPSPIPGATPPKKKVKAATSFHKKKCKNKKFHAKHCKVGAKLKKKKNYKKLVRAAKQRHKKKCIKVILK